MKAALQASAWYEQILKKQLNSATGQHPWLKQLKKEASDSFLRLGFPNRKQEAWRYVNLDKILRHTFVPATQLAMPVPQSTVPAIESHFIPNLESYRLVFMDNQYRADLSSVSQISQGITIQGLGQTWSAQASAVQPWLESSAIHNRNGFTALNTALMCDGVYIHLDNNVVVDKPIELLFLSASQDSVVTSTPRVLVVLSNGAKATLIERFCGTGKLAYFQNVVEEISLAPGSHLNHYRLLQEQSQSYHMSTISVHQDEDSHYNSLNLEFTGSWLRTDFEIDLRGELAQCELNGLTVVDDAQQSEVHINVKHHVQACKSRQNYKGLLLGKGRSVFDGRILVAKNAQQTDAHMSNDNLILCEGAEVDTKPQLEIYADNVKCSHGTTVGQLEPEQLYYLRSRGIEEHEALRMLCQGYASEILANCEINALREFIEEQFLRTLKWNH